MKQYEAVIEKALQLLAPAHPVKVYISSGTHSYTDGEHVVLGLPEVFKTETLDVRYGVLKALAFHELGHVLYSSISNKQWVVDTLSLHFKARFDIPYEVSAYVFRELENSVEDGRVEYFIGRQSKEMWRYLQFLNQRLFKGASLESSFDLLRFLDVALIYSKLNDLDELDKYIGTPYYDVFIKMLPDLKKALRGATPKICGEWIVSMVLAVDAGLAELIKADVKQLQEACKIQGYLEVTSENKVDKATRVAVAFSPVDQLSEEAMTDLLVELGEELCDLTEASGLKKESLKGPGLLGNRLKNPLGDYEPSEIPFDDIDIVRHIFAPAVVPPTYMREGLQLNHQLKAIMDKQLIRDCRPLRSGKLNKKRLYKLALGDTKLFNKKRWLEGKAALSILIDFSSSMSGVKLSTAIHAATVVEIGTRGNIPVSISGYTTKRRGAVHYDIKGFDERVMGMNYTYSFYKNAPYDSCANRDDVAICLEGKALSKRPEAKKILFVISDGLPCVRDDAMLSSIQGVEQKGVEIYGLIVQQKIVNKQVEPECFKKCVFTTEEAVLDNLNALIRQGIKGV